MRRTLWILCLLGCSGAPEPGAAAFRLATFSADITPPVGHALCGGMVAPAKRINDPLSGRGLILWGADEPIVIAALDWTELRNDAYALWRSEIAKAAGTSPRRVLLSCVHQHDAPYADLGAQTLLDGQGLKGFHVDPEFHARAVQTVAAAVREAARAPQTITHLGIGQADVERVASNRRVVVNGKVTFKRYSRTSDPAIRNAPEGLIDPSLKMLSFWDGDRAVAVLSSYAVHPMSRYGGGEVSADFPGLARSKSEQAVPGVFWLHHTGCSGDVTAARYNNADAASKRELADRLHDGMMRAWKQTRRVPLGKIRTQTAELHFDLPAEGPGSPAIMGKVLEDSAASKSDRLMAALGLSWTTRVRKREPIDVTAVNFGPAQFLLLPAEAFVEFQLAAQRRRPDQVVVVAGYGECGPGYIPTEAARAEGYVEEHGYCWVAAGAEEKLMTAISEALR